MMRLALVLVVLVAGGLRVDVRADVPLELTWDDLVPPAPALIDPLAAVEPLAKDDLYFIYHTEKNIGLGYTPAGKEAERMAEERRDRLYRAGIEVDRLLGELSALELEIMRQDQLVDEGLNSNLIRMPGYALPLEMTEDGVTEFLLVPYVGACIHTPPPPPNQMVLVVLDEPYRIQSLYDAVWITGEMRVQSASMALSFVDGEAVVETGYRLKAALVEPYN